MLEEQTGKRGLDFGALRNAVEGGDLDVLLGFYAGDAELRVVGAARPEGEAFELKGRAEIGKYLRAVREGGTRHALKSGAVYGERAIAFVEECRYPDGARVSVETMLEIEGGQVKRHVDSVSRTDGGEHAAPGGEAPDGAPGEHGAAREHHAQTTKGRNGKMTMQTSREERPPWGTKAKALTAWLLVAAMAASLLAPGVTTQAQAADTFTVERTIDTPDANVGDGDCDVSLVNTGFQCTLRAAIQEANATPEPDLIRFSILDGTSGVKTINVGSFGFGALPAITNPVTIDGYTQPGSSPNTKAVGNDAVLKIELAGNGAVGTGLEITNISGTSVVKGLAINRFGEGIDIHGDTVGNRVEGNFIGTDPTGTIDRGNTDDGVNVFGGASENVVGGTTPAARNVISGNAFNAVFVVGATGNRIEGNYIGTDKTGTKALPNGFGGGAAVVITGNSSGNRVGGATAGARNVVSGNGSDGVAIFDGSQNKVLGNRIGTAANGTAALGNGGAGVVLQDSNNSVGDGTSTGSNTIAFNANDGVQVQIGTGHKISRNSIFSNAGIGIDLAAGLEDAFGNTANDPGDVDSGPNGLQNKPVISSAKSSSTKTTIAGKLASLREATYQVQFFSNPSGNEGKTFLGQKSVTTDSNGNASFTFSPASKVAKGQTVTATATNLAGNTSEFSAPKTVGLSSASDLAPQTTKVSGPAGLTKSPAAHFRFDSPDPEATFECSLDGGAYYECSSPENINRLSEGRHSFEARAVDEEGNTDSTPAAWIWSVDRKVSSS